MDTKFHITTDKSTLDIDMIVGYLSDRSYWAKGRSRETIEKSIDNSVCFGVYDHENKQVGFGRVVTDFCVLAWLMDVFILEEYRSRGLGKMLMQEILSYKEFEGIRRWALGTKDAHSLYKRFGFKPIEKPENMMDRIIETM
ncbi:MAG: GCN5-related N-acetyltransferase [Segetibacter sp.]|jgi:N-acetylglutamate synthase-like GNAT family acetyltransferase|nr:GCN5-related N-acetyltransferase [Segetibacter sp.]